MITQTEKARFLLQFCDTLFQHQSSNSQITFNYDGFKKDVKENTFLAPFLSINQLEYGWLSRKPSTLWFNKHTLFTYFQSEHEILLNTFSILQNDSEAGVIHVPITQECTTLLKLFLQDPNLENGTVLLSPFLSYLNAIIAAKNASITPEWEHYASAAFQLFDTLLQLLIRLELAADIAVETLTQVSKLLRASPTQTTTINTDQIHYLIATYTFKQWVTRPLLLTSTQHYWAGWSFSQQLLVFVDGFYNRNSIEKEFKKRLGQYLKYQENLTLILKENSSQILAFSEGFFAYLETQAAPYMSIGAAFFHKLCDITPSEVLFDVLISLSQHLYLHECITLSLACQQDTENPIPTHSIQKLLNLADFPFTQITHALPEKDRHLSFVFPLLKHSMSENIESLLSYLIPIAPPEAPELQVFLSYYFNLSPQQLLPAFESVTQQIIETKLRILRLSMHNSNIPIQAILESLLLICPAHILTAYLAHESDTVTPLLIARIYEVAEQLPSKATSFFATISLDNLGKLIANTDTFSDLHLGLFIDCVGRATPADSQAVSAFIENHLHALQSISINFPTLATTLLTGLNRLYKDCKTDAGSDQAAFLNTYFSLSDQFAEYGITLNTYAAHETLLDTIHAHPDLNQILYLPPEPTPKLCLAWREHPELVIDFVLAFAHFLTVETGNVSRETPISSPFFTTLFPQINTPKTTESLKEMLLALVSISANPQLSLGTHGLSHYFFTQANPTQQYALMRLFLYHPTLVEILEIEDAVPADYFNFLHHKQGLLDLFFNDPPSEAQQRCLDYIATLENHIGALLQQPPTPINPTSPLLLPAAEKVQKSDHFTELPFAALLDWHHASPLLIAHIKDSIENAPTDAQLINTLSENASHLITSFIRFSLDTDINTLPIFDTIPTHDLEILSKATPEADADRLYAHCLLKKIDPVLHPNLLLFLLFNNLYIHTIATITNDNLALLFNTVCEIKDSTFTQKIQDIFPLFSKRYFIRQLEQNTQHATHILSLYTGTELLELIQKSDKIDQLFIGLCTHHSHEFQTLEREELLKFLAQLPIKTVLSIAMHLPQTASFTPLRTVFSYCILNAQTPLEWSQLHLFLADFTEDFSALPITYLNQLFDHFFKQRQIKVLSRTDKHMLNRYLNHSNSRSKLHDADTHCLTPVRDWLYQQNTLTLKQFALDYCEQWLDEDAQVAFLTVIDSLALGTTTVSQGRLHLLEIINKDYELISPDNVIFSHLLSALADNSILFSTNTYSWQSLLEKSEFHESIFVQGLLKNTNSAPQFLASLIEQTPRLGSEITTRLFPSLGALEFWDIFWKTCAKKYPQSTSDTIFSILRSSLMDNNSFQYLCAHISVLSYAKQIISLTKWRSLLSLFNASLSAQNEIKIDPHFFDVLFDPNLFSYEDVCRILLGLFSASPQALSAHFLDFILHSDDDIFTQYWSFLLAHRKEIPLFSDTGFMYDYLAACITQDGDTGILTVAHYLSQSHNSVRPLFHGVLTQLLPEKERPYTWREQVAYDAHLRQITAQISRIFAYQLRHKSEEGMATLFQFSKNNFDHFPSLLRALISTLAQWMTFYPNDIAAIDGMNTTISIERLYDLLKEYGVLNDAGLLSITETPTLEEVDLTEHFPLLSTRESHDITTLLLSYFTVHQTVLKNALSHACTILDTEDHIHELSRSTPEGFTWVSCTCTLLDILRKENPVLLGKVLEVKPITELSSWALSPALSFPFRQALIEIYSYYLPMTKLTLLIRSTTEIINTTSSDFTPHYADLLLILFLHNPVLMAQQFKQYPELNKYYPIFEHTDIQSMSHETSYRKYNLLQLWIATATQKDITKNTQRLSNYLTALTPSPHPIFRNHTTLKNQANCNGLLQANYCTNNPPKFLAFTNLILLQMRQLGFSSAQMIQHTHTFNTFHAALIEQDLNALSRYHFAHIIHGLCTMNGQFSSNLAKTLLTHYPMPYTPSLLTELNLSSDAIAATHHFLTENNYLTNGRLNVSIQTIEKTIEIPHLSSPQTKIVRDHLIHLSIHNQRQLLRIFHIQHDLFALFNTTESTWRHYFIELFLSMSMDKWEIIIHCLTHHEPYMKNILFSDSLRHMLTFELGEHLQDLHLDTLQTIAQTLFTQHKNTHKKVNNDITNTINKMQECLKKPN